MVVSHLNPIVEKEISDIFAFFNFLKFATFVPFYESDIFLGHCVLSIKRA